LAPAHYEYSGLYKTQDELRKDLCVINPATGELESGAYFRFIARLVRENEQSQGGMSPALETPLEMPETPGE